MARFWLFLHILAAVAAFGPGFAFPIIGIVASKTPGSFPLVAKLGDSLGKRLIGPMAILVLITGLLQVYQLKINLLKTPYLLVALILFLVALTLSFLVQMPAGVKLARMADQMQPGQQGPPPPEAMSLIGRQRTTGMVLLLIFVVILALMVFRPGGITTM